VHLQDEVAEYGVNSCSFAFVSAMNDSKSSSGKDAIVCHLWACMRCMRNLVTSCYKVDLYAKRLGSIFNGKSGGRGPAL
jgi:hypothetical protein